jgi:murein DD-endopeptidase MepM/ murein hydrolase activator NlpD
VVVAAVALASGPASGASPAPAPATGGTATSGSAAGDSATAGPAAGGGPARGAAPERWSPADVFAPPLPLDVLVEFRAPATRYGPGHRGVDLAAADGATVLAAADGTVVHAGPVAGRGVVSIEHRGGVRTTYEPVRALVEAGEQVTRGQPIGILQAGHASCVPAVCLHLGARLPDRIYLDPLALFRPWRIRLKPWGG